MDSTVDGALVEETERVKSPTVIGLYGLPGSGKSSLMSYLKIHLHSHLEKHGSHRDLAFYEGSDVIARLVPGGLEAFQALDEQGKAGWRVRAIEGIKKEALANKTTAIVTGHFMFWSEGQAVGQPVYTPNDLDIFTHIIYLNTPPTVIFQRRLDDKMRNRPAASIEHLHKWQWAEISGLRELCRQHCILFLTLRDYPASLCSKALAVVEYFLDVTTVPCNNDKAITRLGELYSEVKTGKTETALVLDADKTLAPMDTGYLSWEAVDQDQSWTGSTCDLPELFDSPLGYSEKAFHQATLMYEEHVHDDYYDARCEAAASKVVMYPEFVSLLRAAARRQRVFAVVVTCGLARVWEKVLERYGLFDTVKVLGGGRISDGFVVSPTTKANVVHHLRYTENLCVWAFGDSPLDIPMLRTANEAIVVVGDEQLRSASMDTALAKALEDGRFKGRQALLPDCVPPRLDETKLPLVRLDDPDFLESVFRPGFLMHHATDKKAAKLLMSPMRDASIAGHVLREAHRRAGWYLAVEFVTGLIGVEEYPIPHVQGRQASGSRLQDEQWTTIVALMRGGEPMASGVSEAFPSAMFVHAAAALDIKDHHLEHQGTVILVDSVINSGKTIIDFIERIRSSHPNIRIVVVAGVVQVGATRKGHDLHTILRRSGSTLVALRLSENKFTGTKSTDTGNRLFNTTHLD